MKKRPLILTILALIHFLYPIGYTAQVIYFQSIPLEYIYDLIKVLFNPFKGQEGERIFFALCVCSLFVGYGLFKVRAWAFWLFIFNSIFTIVYNIYLHIMFRDYDPIPLEFRLSVVIVTLAFMFYFIRKHIRAPYFNPKLRWWENAPRYKTQDIAVTYTDMTKTDSKIFHGDIFDMSSGGLFVVSDNDCILGTKFNINFTLLAEVTINCAGTVVWISGGGKKHPKGFGVMFTDISKNNKRQINTYLKSLSKELRR